MDIIAPIQGAVKIMLAPGASCSVRVVYASGAAARSVSLPRDQTMNSDARVHYWSWKPATSRPGLATATVTCSRGGKAATGTARFTVI